MDTTTTTITTEKKTFTRDQIRAAVANNGGKNPEEIVEAFGVQIAVKAPSLRELSSYQGMATDDETLIARSIIGNCYVPGTSEKVFDETDVEWINEQPFNEDMRKLNAVINKILQGDDIASQVEANVKSVESQSTPVVGDVSGQPAA